MNDGVLHVSHDDGLGGAETGTTVNDGATLALDGDLAIAEPLTLNGAGADSAGALSGLGGTSTVSGAITLTTTATIAVDDETLTLTGAISGTGGLTTAGPGTLALTGDSSNTYNGTTTVLSGTLDLGRSGVIAVPGAIQIGGTDTTTSALVRLLVGHQIANTAAVTVRESGELALNGFNDTIGSLTLRGSAVTTAGDAETGTLTLGGNVAVQGVDATATIDGKLHLGGTTRTFTVANGDADPDLVVNAVVSGGGITKAGAGTMVLTADNTYTGTTTISDGTLVIDGDQPDSAVDLDGGTLGGSGTVGGVTAAGGTLSPGGSPGVLTVNGNLTLEEDATLFVDLEGTAGTQYDVIVVDNGTVTINGATLDGSVTFEPAPGTTFQIIDNQKGDVIQGDGFGNVEDGEVTIDEQTFTISHTGGSGNNVVLTAAGDGNGDPPNGGGPGPGPDPEDPDPVVFTRLSGADRIATAVEVSKNAWAGHGTPDADTAEAVVLARASDFADALAGTPLAVAKGGPLLLTNTASLDARTKAEIDRLLEGSGTVYVLGGTAAISDAVTSELTTAGYTVQRFFGANRFETAVKIADEGLDNPGHLLLATGLNFPDALGGAAAAAEVGGAILLTAGSDPAAATTAYLNDHPDATRYALGGPAAAAYSVPAANRFVGTNRYETATLVAAHFFTDPAAVGVATGEDFPDALSGGAHIATHRGPLLLTGSSTLNSFTRDYLVANADPILDGFIYGGTAVVSNAVKTAIESAINDNK